MPTFATVFTSPGPPTDLVATSYLATSRIELSWAPSALGVDFDGYRIYRSIDGGVTYAEIGSVNVEATATYVDYEAPMDVPVLYGITVSNPDFESTKGLVSSQLDEHAWYLATPGMPTYTFRIQYVHGFRERERLQRQRLAPLGRRFPVIVTGELEASSGRVELEVHPPDAWLIRRIRELAVLDVPYVLLKTPFGDVYRVKLDPDERERTGVAGIQNFGFAYDAVA